MSCWNVRRKDKGKMQFIMQNFLDNDYTGYIFAGFDMMIDAFPSGTSGLYSIPKGFTVASFTSDARKKTHFDSFYKIVWPTEILTENACEMLLRRIDGFNAPPRRIRADCHVIPPEK